MPESAPLAAALVDSYLQFLGLSRETPSLDALARLTRQQVLHVRFENVSAQVRGVDPGATPLPDPAERVAAWTSRAGGGVCFDVSATMHALLSALGYTTWCVAAIVRPPGGGRGFPGGHQANLVIIDGQRYLVDAGNGAPFFEPVPVSETFEVHSAGLGYRFHPGDAPGVVIQERQLPSGWEPFCEYDTNPASAELLEQAYRRHLTPGQSWVVDDVVFNRCSVDAVHMLRGGVLTTFTADGKHTNPIVGVDEYESVARDILELPGLPVRQAFAMQTARRGSAAQPG
jgi:arylamine N-acetyltransferase